MSIDDHAQAQAFKPTIWHRLGFRHAHVLPHDDERFPEPEWAPGCLTSDTFVYLDLVDRLRALISGRLMVTTRTKTDVTVKRAHTVSATSVLPPGTAHCR